MKIEKRNFLHFLSFLLAALMIFSLTPLSVYAADRSVTPKYDFSSVDDINIYDTYEKRETATGISYVRVGKQHFYDWNNPSAFESARYGSFLRNNEETQFFEIGNAPFSSQLDLNILTIYADPEVKFSMTDYYGNFVVDSEGNYNLFMKTKGYTYIDLLSEYQGTPSFSSPIFTFDDGKFNMTYTTN